MTTSKISKEEVMPVNPESNGNALDLENFLSSPIKVGQFLFPFSAALVLYHKLVDLDSI